MSERRKPRAPAGSLETEVLEALWEFGPLSTPEVHTQVGRPRRLAYTTILTVLHRLTKKGLVTRHGAGRSHIYGAAVSRRDYAEAQARQIAVTLVELGEVGVAAFLAEAGRLDAEVMRKFRQQLETS